MINVRGGGAGLRISQDGVPLHGTLHILHILSNAAFEMKRNKNAAIDGLKTE